MRPRYQLFGDYVLLRKIATGGMAEVQLAIKRGPGRFNRLVALKTILSHRTDHEAFVSMFYNEARLGARFNHPNLVNVFDVHEIDETLTMVMEYVPGNTVSDVVRRCVERGIDFRRAYAIRIVLDACLGLYHAHHLRDLDGTPLEVVHRDVSPQNILVGYSGQVKVFDFGIASTGSSGESEQLSGVLAGKYAYMSPEQCHGAELDERSDVFSLGILLWELTTQQRLFRRKNQIEVLRAITEEPIKSPSAPRRLPVTSTRSTPSGPRSRSRSSRSKRAGSSRSPATAVARWPQQTAAVTRPTPKRTRPSASPTVRPALLRLRPRNRPKRSQPTSTEWASRPWPPARCGTHQTRS